MKADRKVVINRTELTSAELTTLEQQFGAALAEGQYWYDRACGAWGMEGGPTVGFVMPGLQVGGPLPADVSAGTTGVFINGRELHALDVAGLQQLGPVWPGRYWVDAYWNCGYQGGPPLFNIAQIIQSQSAARKGGAWSHTTKGFTNNITVGGDGAGFIHVSGKDHKGDSYTYMT